MIRIKATASGQDYKLGLLWTGHHQYMDRLYQFAHVPEELVNTSHVMTYGSDKMIPENEWCFTLEVDSSCETYVLYADKQPRLPIWMETIEWARMNVTRMDSIPMTLKGYFSLYKKNFPAGEIKFYGNSPLAMIEEDWYVESQGAGYCMYSVAIREEKHPFTYPVPANFAGMPAQKWRVFAVSSYRPILPRTAAAMAAAVKKYNETNTHNYIVEYQIYSDNYPSAINRALLQRRSLQTVVVWLYYTCCVTFAAGLPARPDPWREIQEGERSNDQSGFFTHPFPAAAGKGHFPEAGRQSVGHFPGPALPL